MTAVPSSYNSCSSIVSPVLNPMKALGMYFWATTSMTIKL